MSRPANEFHKSFFEQCVEITRQHAKAVYGIDLPAPKPRVPEVKVCQVHGVILAFDGDECWECARVQK